MALTAAIAAESSRASVKARLIILATTAAVALTAGSAAAAAGNTQAGRDLARQKCADCHRLPDGNGGGEARPLTAYRDQQPFTGAGLRKLIGSWPHAGRVKLPPDHAYPDLAAFLNSLDRAAASPDRGPAGGTSGTADRPASDRAGARPDRKPIDRTPGTPDRPADRRDTTKRLDLYGNGREREREEEYEDEEHEGYEDD